MRPVDSAGGHALPREAGLRERLERLPPGHPSSPYDADGQARRADRPEPGDLERDELADGDRGQADRPEPLSDAEWDEHVGDIRDRLGTAAADGLATDRQHTVDPDRQDWSRERNRLQGAIVAELYQQASDVPCTGQAIIAGGLGGAGKSTVLGRHAGIDTAQYLTINPDDIKEHMARRGLVPAVEGLSPMEATELVHEESSHIAKRLAMRATAEQKNVIWDITMSSRESTDKRIDQLREAGYAVTGIFVDIPVETSVRRAEARHRAGHEDYRAGLGLGGRYVPPEVIRSQADAEWGSQNRKTFEAVRHRFDQWSRYDNSIDGRAPLLADASDHPEEEP